MYIIETFSMVRIWEILCITRDLFNVVILLTTPKSVECTSVENLLYGYQRNKVEIKFIPRQQGMSGCQAGRT